MSLCFNGIFLSTVINVFGGMCFTWKCRCGTSGNSASTGLVVGYTIIKKGTGCKNKFSSP